MRNPFRRRSRIDGAAREALRSAGAGRVVAWATDGSGGVVVATVAELAVVDAGGAISLTPWHEVLSGRWVADASPPVAPRRDVRAVGLVGPSRHGAAAPPCRLRPRRG